MAQGLNYSVQKSEQLECESFYGLLQTVQVTPAAMSYYDSSTTTLWSVARYSIIHARENLSDQEINQGGLNG